MVARDMGIGRVGGVVVCGRYGGRDIGCEGGGGVFGKNIRKGVWGSR